MVKALGFVGDRLLSLFVPKTDASACYCWYTNCRLPDGSTGRRECCKLAGTLWCDACY